jgi:hypothetical protein
MNVLQPEEYRERLEPVPPFQIHIASYRLGAVYYCSVNDVDPGAVIARSEGSTREEAELKAITRANERLGHSKVYSER